MKTLPPGFQTVLDGDAMRLALLMEIRRTDGTILRFTDHDDPVTVQDTFVPGITITDSTQKNTTAPGTSTQKLLIDDASISEADVRSGRFDGAEVFLWIADWSQPGLGRVALPRGTLGAADSGDTDVDVELRSLTDRLRQNVSQLFLTACDADLGDARCKVDLGPFTHSGTVSAVTSATVFDAADLVALATGYFQFGSLVWLTGQNAGKSNQIKVHTQEVGAARITTSFPSYFAIEVGDTFTAIAGCSKDFASACRDKFSNVENFRGFPFVPGQNEYLKQGGQ
jgi:uncharacterized phage protein (TIGR02218 family)